MIVPVDKKGSRKAPSRLVCGSATNLVSVVAIDEDRLDLPAGLRVRARSGVALSRHRARRALRLDVDAFLDVALPLSDDLFSRLRDRHRRRAEQEVLQTATAASRFIAGFLSRR